MKLFSIHPEVHSFDSAAQFCAEMQIGTGDLIISNEYILRPAFDGALQGSRRPISGKIRNRRALGPARGKHGAGFERPVPASVRHRRRLGD